MSGVARGRGSERSPTHSQGKLELTSPLFPCSADQASASQTELADETNLDESRLRVKISTDAEIEAMFAGWFRAEFDDRLADIMRRLPLPPDAPAFTAQALAEVSASPAARYNTPPTRVVRANAYVRVLFVAQDHARAKKMAQVARQVQQSAKKWRLFGIILPSASREAHLEPIVADHASDCFEELTGTASRVKRNWIICRYTIMTGLKVFDCWRQVVVGRLLNELAWVSGKLSR
jgi:hypothetical protein